MIFVGQLRGGGESVVTIITIMCLNNYAYFKLFTEHSMTITIMQRGKQ
jgi:hypothetical protein